MRAGLRGPVVCVAGAAVLLSMGCKSKKAAANDANFTKALNTYFYTHDDCLFQNGLKLPYEASATGKGDPQAAGLDALTSEGLLKREEDRSIHVKRYSVTPLGSKAVPRFCYGHRVVTAIQSFTPPNEVDGHYMSTVNYSFSLKDVPLWAQSATVQHAFPAMAKEVAGQGTGKTDVMLAFNGWEVPQ